MFPPPEAPYSLFPYLFLADLILTSGFFVVQRLRSPQVVCKMQRDLSDDRFATQPIALPRRNNL